MMGVSSKRALIVSGESKAFHDGIRSAGSNLLTDYPSYTALAAWRYLHRLLR
jgi:hypothetical protein